MASNDIEEADHEDKDRDNLNNDNDKDKDANAMTTTTTTVMTKTTKGEDLPPPPPPLWDGPLSPYLGKSQTYIEIAEAIRAASPWLDIKKMSNDPESSSSKIIDIIIDNMGDGGVVALNIGRSEMGP